ncbi:MAG: hypothetical protein JWQ18_429 [Conexibacter sp.]|nr:hypothetical protein [Conexibacter sp.]
MSDMVVIDEAARATLASLVDVMLPGGSGLPSGREVDVAGRLLDDVLTARPDLAEPLRAVLGAVGGDDPSTAVRALSNAADRSAHDVLALVVAGAYVMAPAVGAALSYPGQEPKPVNPFDINDVVDDGLLDDVIERGSIYRPTPQNP